jgi:hypothetical protein
MGLFDKLTKHTIQCFQEFVSLQGFYDYGTNWF